MVLRTRTEQNQFFIYLFLRSRSASIAGNSRILGGPLTDQRSLAASSRKAQFTVKVSGWGKNATSVLKKDGSSEAEDNVSRAADLN